MRRVWWSILDETSSHVKFPADELGLREQNGVGLDGPSLSFAAQRRRTEVFVELTGSFIGFAEWYVGQLCENILLFGHCVVGRARPVRMEAVRLDNGARVRALCRKEDASVNA